MPVLERKEVYASYERVPDIPYDIISFLINSEEGELIWKLLYYPDPDAWNMPNLSKEQKRKLIYNGIGDPVADDYRVFIDPSHGAGIHDQQTILRVFIHHLVPDDPYVGTCGVSFEVFSHFQINTLSNNKERMAVIISEILRIFHGRDMESYIGRMFFNKMEDRRNEMGRIGFTPMRGIELVMSVKVS